MASKGPTRAGSRLNRKKQKQKQKPSQKDQYSLMDIKQGIFARESLSFNLTVESRIEVGLPKPRNSIEQLEYLAKVESAFGSYGPHEARTESNQCPKPKLMKELLGLNGFTCPDDKNVRLSIEKPHEDKIDMKVEIESRIKSSSELLATDKNGQTILHGAALNGAHELAEEVMRHESPEIALRDVVDMCDRTALHFAVMIGDERMVNVIVNDDENINVNKKDMLDQTPLYVAAENGHVEIVSMLIGLGGEPDSVDRLGNTPLFGAVRAQSSQIVKNLLEIGVSVNHRNWMKATPLHYAVLTGNVKVVRLLLDKGAEANARERMERTPLMLVCIGEASTEQCTEVGKLLLARYTPEDIGIVGRNRSQAIHYALRRQNVDLINALMERGADIHSMDEFGLQPIHYAVEIENPDLTKSLIERGADIHAVSESGSQPIHISVARGNCEVTEVLIKNGADIDAQHEIVLGTPLHFSVALEHLHVFKLLLKAGANSDIKDKNLRTPLDLAFGQSQFVHLLKGHRSNRTAKKRIKQRAEPSEEAPSMKTDQPTSELDTEQPKTEQEEESTAKCDVLVPAKSEKDKPSTSTDQQTSELDAEQPKTQQEDESAATCDALVPAKGDKDKNKHLHPVMSKDEVDAMVDGMKELLKQRDPETLAECNIVLSKRNFAMAIIGPKGGDLSFADHSVTMKIPAGALSDTRVISCYRPVNLKNTKDDFKKSDWVFYAPELICGPDGTKFNKPISVRMKHILTQTQNDMSTGDDFTVITKGDNADNWQEDEGNFTFDGDWINLEVDHFTSISFGSRADRKLQDINIFLSTSFTEDGDGEPLASQHQRKPPRPPTTLHIFLSDGESRMKDIKWQRYDTYEGEQISCCNYLISSINLNADLFIKTISMSYKRSNGEIIRVQDLRNMTPRGLVDDSPITHLPDSEQDEDNMIKLERPYQPRPEGHRGTIPCDTITVKRSAHSHIPPEEDFTTNFGDIDNMLCNRQLLRPSRPGRRVMSFPIQETMNLPVSPPIEIPRQQPTPGQPQNVMESVRMLANQFGLVHLRQSDEATVHEDSVDATTILQDGDITSHVEEDSDVTSADAHEDSDVGTSDVPSHAIQEHNDVTNPDAHGQDDLGITSDSESPDIQERNDITFDGQDESQDQNVESPTVVVEA